MAYASSSFKTSHGLWAPGLFKRPPPMFLLFMFLFNSRYMELHGCAFRVKVPWKIFKDVSSCASLDLCLALVIAAALSRNLPQAAVFLTASQYEPVVSAQHGIQGLFL